MNASRPRIDPRSTLRPRVAIGRIYAEVAAVELEERRRVASPSLREFTSRLRPPRGPGDLGGALIADWGEMRVGEISVGHCEGWVAAYAQQEIRPGEVIAGNTVRTVGSIHSAVLARAVELGELASNPYRQMRPGTLPPKRPRDPDRRRMEILTEEQARAVVLAGLHSLDRDEWALWGLWLTLLLAGLRWGEAAALRWGDLSLQMRPLGEIHVQRTRHKGGGYGPPKGGHTRRVPLHPALRRALRLSEGWYRVHEQRSPDARDLLWPGARRGLGPASHSTSLRLLRAQLDALGIPTPAAGQRGHHATTRYTWCSHLYRAGAAWRLIESMSHRATDSWSEGSALPVYAHASWEQVCDAILRLPYAPKGAAVAA